MRDKYAFMNSTPLKLKSGLRVGILGGGQLARMLAEAALRLGLRPVVYAENAESPAARATADRYFGHLGDESALGEFFRHVDLAVFENEFVRCDLLERCAGAVPFLPSLNTLKELRDKLRQKQLLNRLGIPTAPFVAYDGSPLNEWMAAAASRFGGSCVFKWGQLGYDGKGVFVMRKHGAEKETANLFCQGAIKAGVSLFAEEVVAFQRELALVSVRSTTGECATYPLVVSEQKNGICVLVTGPATALGVDKELESQAKEISRKVGEATNALGCYAIEFFHTTSGELMVNEIAPRVHNSGHYTQDGALTSQFENHWRGVLGLPLGSTDNCGEAFVMLNILGPAGISRSAEGLELPVPPPRSHLHWYDKSATSPGRKIGHLNAVASKVEALPALVKALSCCLETWENGLSQQGEKK